MSHLVLCDLMLCDLVMCDLVTSHLVLCDLVLCDLVMSHLVSSRVEPFCFSWSHQLSLELPELPHRPSASKSHSFSAYDLDFLPMLTAKSYYQQTLDFFLLCYVPCAFDS